MLFPYVSCEMHSCSTRIKCMEQDAFCSATGIGDRVLWSTRHYKRVSPKGSAVEVALGGHFPACHRIRQTFPLFFSSAHIYRVSSSLLFLSTEKSKHHALPLSNTPIHSGHQPPPKRRCRFTPSLATRVSTDICRRGRLPPSSLPSDSTVARFLVP